MDSGNLEFRLKSLTFIDHCLELSKFKSHISQTHLDILFKFSGFSM